MNWNIYIQRHSCNCNCKCPKLQDEGENGTTTLGIILKLLPVVAVLAQSPHSHLEGTGKSEKISWQA